MCGIGWALEVGTFIRGPGAGSLPREIHFVGVSV